MAINFSSLDPILSLLEKYKKQLGPLYRPLHVLCGAIIFLLILVAILLLPGLCLPTTSSTHVVFAQVAIVAVYFVLLNAIRQNVFDRFVFSAVLFLVITAAPNAIGLDLNESFQLIPPLLFLDRFTYAILRGLPCTLWSAPLLFYFFTFAPAFEAKEAVKQEALTRALWIGLGLHVMATGLSIWLSSLWPRFAASKEGAIPVVAGKIESYQHGFFLFSCLYLGTGFLALLLTKFWSRASAARVQLIVVLGLVLGQIFFAIADYNVRALNARYPAAHTTGSAVEAYGTEDGSEVVFVNTWYRQISRDKTIDLYLYAVCTSPDSGKFSFKVASGAEFRAKYPKEVDLAILAQRSAKSRFCQPAE